MKKELNLLLVEDNDGDVRIIKELLKEQSIMVFKITIAGSLAEAFENLSNVVFDIILLDLGLPDSQGYETFIRLIKMYPKVNAIIILTGLNDTDVGLNAMYEGAQDYIIKGNIDSDKLTKSIIYSFERNRLNIELKEQLEAIKIAEEALIKSRDKAEESDRLKTAFLHNISHEIRTPMNAIVGFSALLSEPDLSLETRQSFIETIVQSSNNLLAIITDIVDISNIDAKLVKISESEVELNKVITTVADIFRLRIKETMKQLNLKTRLPSDGVKTLTDTSKFYQVLSNLVNNAIKFTLYGEIEIGYTKGEQNVEFYVSDTGIGISEDNFNKIFDRFYQVEYSETRQYEGTGLGLSISKAYVELLGGKIWVNSELGKGTVFHFTLPLKEQGVNHSINLSLTDRHKVIGRGKRILVAEDIESNFKLIRFYLSSIGAETIRAENGNDAVDYFRSNPDIDLILMDIKMPLMDGYEAVKLIRKINNKIPIIMQTAYADDRIKSSESGCNGFLSKPFNKEQLISLIKEYI